ncbi:hypothetical protein ACI3PL_24525, partial [Lacticaseibacillus paracasei]
MPAGGAAVFIPAPVLSVSTGGQPHATGERLPATGYAPAAITVRVSAPVGGPADWLRLDPIAELLWCRRRSGGWRWVH